MKNLVILTSIAATLLFTSCSKDENCPTDVLDGTYIKIIPHDKAPNSYDTITVSTTLSRVSVSNFSYWNSHVSFDKKGKSGEYGTPVAYRTFKLSIECDKITIKPTVHAFFIPSKEPSVSYKKIE